jgi:hypothetical protein
MLFFGFSTNFYVTEGKATPCVVACISRKQEKVIIKISFFSQLKQEKKENSVNGKNSRKIEPMCGRTKD